VATLVATSIPSSASNPSTEPRNLDDSDAGRLIYASRPRLRALWTLWSVEVRVLSGALGKPRTAGLFAAVGMVGEWARGRHSRPSSDQRPRRAPRDWRGGAWRRSGAAPCYRTKRGRSRPGRRAVPKPEARLEGWRLGASRRRGSSDPEASTASARSPTLIIPTKASWTNCRYEG